MTPDDDTIVHAPLRFAFAKVLPRHGPSLRGLAEHYEPVRGGGFTIEMSTNELAAHLEARARWYDEAADRAGERVVHWLPGGPAAAREVARRRARDFRFLAGHLAPGVAYRLDALNLEYLDLVVPCTSLMRLVRRALE